MVKKHPVVVFYLLAILISWVGWLPVVLGSRGVAFFQAPIFQSLLILPAVGPMLAAIIVSRKTDGRSAARGLLRPLAQWRVPLQWYVIAVALPVLFLTVGKLVTDWLGLPADTHVLTQENRIATFVAAFLIALLANPWEEVGWRGFALPRLQSRYSAFRSSLIVGLLWGVWHLPLFLWSGHPMSEQSFWLSLVDTLAAACIYTWVYNNTEGSLLIVTLYHVAWNTCGAMIVGASDLVMTVESWIAVLVLVLWFGGENLAHHPRVCRIPEL